MVLVAFRLLNECQLTLLQLHEDGVELREERRPNVHHHLCACIVLPYCATTRGNLRQAPHDLRVPW